MIRLYGNGNGSQPRWELAGSGLLAACFSLVVLEYYVVSLGKSEGAKDQQKSNDHIQYIE